MKVTIETKPSDLLGVKAEPLIFERELKLPYGMFVSSKVHSTSKAKSIH